MGTVTHTLQTSLNIASVIDCQPHGRGVEDNVVVSELHKNPAINAVAVNGPYQGFIVVATLNESTPSPQGISYLHFIELITPLGYCFMPICV